MSLNMAIFNKNTIWKDQEKYRQKLLMILLDAGKSEEEVTAYGFPKGVYRREMRKKTFQ